jgi:hypothetical protein
MEGEDLIKQWIIICTCQAQPYLQVKLSFKAELAVLSLLYQHHHHPAGIVVF